MIRRGFRLFAGLLMLSSFAVACDHGVAGTEEGGRGPCGVEPRPAGCGMPCSAGSACPAGFYCGATGTCTADCTPSFGCAGAQTCSTTGQCVSPPSAQDASSGDGSVCANVSLDTKMVVPTIVLLVDQSGSMGNNQLPDGMTRWDALEASLVGPKGVAGPDGMGVGATGLVFDYQDKVRFGLALYSGTELQCPNVITEPTPLLALAPGAYSPIKVVYDQALPTDWTPTHLAMQQVLDGLLGLADPLPPPVLFILATDGEPNECIDGTSDVARPEVLTQTRRAFDHGIRTYVISLAGEDAALQAHLNEVANVGLGLPADNIPPATTWAPADAAGLRDALDTIIGGALSCTIELSGQIDPTMACTGRVTLNGVDLPCDDPNGWRAVDTRHIEVVGTACETISGPAGGILTAEFPCFAVLI